MESNFQIAAEFLLGKNLVHDYISDTKVLKFSVNMTGHSKIKTSKVLSIRLHCSRELSHDPQPGQATSQRENNLLKQFLVIILFMLMPLKKIITS